MCFSESQIQTRPHTHTHTHKTNTTACLLMMFDQRVMKTGLGKGQNGITLIQINQVTDELSLSLYSLCLYLLYF